MFETYDTARLPSFFAKDGEYLWSYVGIHLQYAWFQVTYRITVEDAVDISETLFLSHVEQLMEITKRDNIKIEFVDLVSPGYMNGSKRWKMEPLREIWLCASDKSPLATSKSPTFGHPKSPRQDGQIMSLLRRFEQIGLLPL